MKDYEILDAVGGIDPAFVNDAAKQPVKKKPAFRFQWAAAVCALLAMVLIIPAVLRKGGTPSYDDGYQALAPLRLLKFNGMLYEAVEEPAFLKQHGLPETVSEDMVGPHLSWLILENDTYQESAAETDIELLAYTKAEGRSVYILHENDTYTFMLFCNILAYDSNTCSPFETLYAVYGINSADDLVSIAETDWNRNKTIGKMITDRSEIETFYEASLKLEPYGNDDFQAQMFDGIEEEKQTQIHSEFADDCRAVRLETADGRYFWIDVHPSFGWIYGRGTLSYYPVSEEMNAWLQENLH